jgi:hypothetical protein
MVRNLAHEVMLPESIVPIHKAIVVLAALSRYARDRRIVGRMPYAALAELLAVAQFDAAVRDVDIRGRDPVFATPFRIGETGAAAIAACALAADGLWRVRCGETSKQAISVDMPHAAAALRGVRYMQIDGVAPKDLFDPLSGLYQAQHGRWIYLHCNFEPHREAALRTLGLAGDASKEAIAASVRERDAAMLEDEVHAAGGCAGLVRTREEWAEDPQSRAVASLRLIDIERIGDAPREPLPRAPRPLTGIRVLDLTRVRRVLLAHAHSQSMARMC